MCLQRLLQSEAAFLNACFTYFWKKWQLPLLHKNYLQKQVEAQ